MGVGTFHTAPFVKLGEQIDRGLAASEWETVIEQAVTHNGWFTRESILSALRAIRTQMLTEGQLTEWLTPYADKIQGIAPRKVGVITAGNLPLVGFFDLLAVSVCGHECYLKPSSKDRVLMEWVIDQLRTTAPELPIHLWDGAHPKVEALIATGSDNTNRYFRAQYPEIPTLLRGSRSSLALISGSETPQELEGLSNDLFQYFGMGCRNVSHLLLPEGYDPAGLIPHLQIRPVTHPKYRNAYRQTRALNTLKGVPFLDGAFFLLREGEWGGDHPLCEITYNFYRTPSEAERWILRHDHEIQCIVSHPTLQHPRRVDFGAAQSPRLWDYADGVDVIDFLSTLE